MIHITQGHEKSISIEVLLKALLLISPKQTKKLLKLHASEQTLIQNAALLNLDINISKDSLGFYGHKIYFQPIPQGPGPQSTASLLSAINQINEKDILITLPTSKDQLLLNKKNPLGHTEFLRLHYGKPDLPMFFYSKGLKVLLLTDHIPLARVSAEIKKHSAFHKVQACIDGYKKYFGDIDEMIFTGVNPHAGEGGLLGNEESELTLAISELSANNPDIKFIGPVAGDTAHLKLREQTKQILVYSFHDQGLSYFKSVQNYFGINTTFGLPFLRLSPDHGTAFELWGKNKANPLGFHDVLIKALSIGQKNGIK